VPQGGPRIGGGRPEGDGRTQETTIGKPRPVKQTRTFNAPTFDKYRVDWCLNGTQCGAPAAHAYCKLHRYDRATDFDKADNIGLTRRIGDKKICNQKTCDGFSEIKCLKQDHVAVR
jgi:hypothetical protein